MATSAPAPARASAMARPIRFAPPVTSADWPASGRDTFTEGLFQKDASLPGLKIVTLGNPLLRLAGIGGLVLVLVLILFAVPFVFGVRLVNGVLLAGALHAHLDRHLVLLDLVVAAISLVALGNDLQADGFADGQHVDHGLAVLVGLQLHVARVIARLVEGVEDDGGVFNGFAVVAFEHGDFDFGGRRRSLVLAATLGGILGKGGRTRHQGDERQNQAGTEKGTAIHSNYCTCHIRRAARAGVATGAWAPQWIRVRACR